MWKAYSQLSLWHLNTKNLGLYGQTWCGTDGEEGTIHRINSPEIDERELFGLHCEQRT